MMATAGESEARFGGKMAVSMNDDRSVQLDGCDADR
jgi:hypothetical protein